MTLRWVRAGWTCAGRIALPVWAALLVAITAGAEPHDYVGVQKCRSCHKKELIGNQVAAWRKGPHARAFETLRNEQSVQLAAERGIAKPPHESDACLRCHATPVGVPPERIHREMEVSDGVQCESCHGPGRDYRKKKIMSDRDEAVAKGLWLAGEDPGICTACHNEQSPTHDPERYTLDDGSKVGFDFDQAVERIDHPIPADVKGRYLELDKARRDAEKEAAKSR